MSNAYEKVKKARDVHRISTLDFINNSMDSFIELHGDRYQEDDNAIVGGVGLLNGQPITIIGIQKGRDTPENIRRNFGSAKPSGYRKAIRLMHQAEKFNRPILTFINTPGASASPDSEETGIGEAIAETLLVMAEVTVPTLVVILGEGGSGGALALALTDEVWMMENSVYSILSPEGFATILWKDAKRATEAADVMKLTAQELHELGIVDQIIPETNRGIDLKHETILKRLKESILKKFQELQNHDIESLLEQRYQRFRKY